MTNIPELFAEVERLPISTKWELVRYLLRSLEQAQSAEPPRSDWHQFLSETYGSLRDSPIERWSQGDYEERESLE
ncbi:MAG: hypothetical protein L0154_14505 [Chloroflexi bacterium]|nr:hypothetical protein [Chloroflexota bacterium]